MLAGNGGYGAVALPVGGKPSTRRPARRRAINVVTSERHAHEHPAIREHAVEVEAELPEVDFALGARRMPLRDVHLHQHRRLPPAHVSDVAAHLRLAHLCVMLVDEALPRPARRVTLLAGRLAVPIPPGVDRRLPLAPAPATVASPACVAKAPPTPSASRIVRRCVPNRRANSRIDTPGSTRRARRICSNNSTLDRFTISPPSTASRPPTWTLNQKVGPIRRAQPAQGGGQNR